MCDKCHKKVRRIEFYELESKAKKLRESLSFHSEELQDKEIVSNIQNAYKQLELIINMIKGR